MRKKRGAEAGGLVPIQRAESEPMRNKGGQRRGEGDIGVGWFRKYDFKNDVNDMFVSFKMSFSFRNIVNLLINMT